ncbi:MAG TPA: transketolase [Armatimonadota bacterium]|nr:transketolase [Armatimonadota bacterium]
MPATTLVPTQNDMDQLAVNTIRTLAMDGVQRANSGHPGTPMALAPVAYCLYHRYLRHNPKNPHWTNRDRFVLSAGHASMLLYSILHITGYDLELEHLKNFRQWDSKCPGHPEHDFTPGVETTTGPLGHGIATSVGMAAAEKWLASHFNRPGHDVVDYRVYAICGDGCMMEGISHEAASLAGHLGLNNLIWFYDNNHITIEGNTSLAFTEDVAARFSGYHWNVLRVGDANDLDLLSQAIETAHRETDRPTLIIVDSHIAYGAPHKQDTSGAHGEPLGEEEIRLTKRRYGWPEDAQFLVPDEVKEHTMKEAVARGKALESEWQDRFDDYSKAFPELAREWDQIQNGELPHGWDADIPTFPADPKGVAGREASAKVQNAIAKNVPWLIGGSADLAPSTKTRLTDGGDFEKGSYGARNFHFGIREHEMGAFLNGMALSKLKVYGSGFLIFSDFLRPSIRLSALMELPIAYIFTHDSIGVGEDGPTHQPIEQLISLRAIPNLVTMRPCDGNEVAESWRYIMKSKKHPVALILSRQNLPTLDRTRYAPANGLHKGGYVLSDCDGKPDVLLMATGSEVSLLLETQDRLAAEGVKSRVISLPSWEVFEQQPLDYRLSVMPVDVRHRLALEAGTSLGWRRYVGIAPDGAVVALRHFGASAPLKDLLKHFGFTVEHLVDETKLLLAGKKVDK